MLTADSREEKWTGKSTAIFSRAQALSGMRAGLDGIYSLRDRKCAKIRQQMRESPSAKYMKNTSQLLHVITRTAAHPICVELIAQIVEKIERSGQVCR